MRRSTVLNILPFEQGFHDTFYLQFQMVKMFIVVVVIFGVCWLPYHGYFIYTYHHSDVVKKPFIQHVYLVIEQHVLNTNAGKQLS
jgi:hypothetical protein